MLRFLLEGSLGEILAPVTGTLNQLNLAIQHHRNQEITAILARENVDLSKIGDSGYAALHVACRFNNRFAFDLILDRGISVNLPDSNQNTPLHYAAKYGHIDLCRVLIEKGASTVARNDQRQTPYDVAENHSIRQYLLPLQLQSERQFAQDAYSFAPSAQIYQQQQQPAAPFHSTPSPGPGTGVVPPVAAPSSSGSAPPPMVGAPVAAATNPTPPPIFNPTPLNLGRVSSPNTNPDETTAILAPATPTTPSGSAPVGPPVGPPAAANWPAKPNPAARQVSGGSNSRIIADGFHSSASDPNLQAKYGHVKEVVNIAPPPTGPIGGGPGGGAPGAPPVYSMFSGSAPQQYNRYVAYDPYAPPGAPPAAAPAAYPTSSGYSTGVFGSSSSSLPTYSNTAAAPPPMAVGRSPAPVPLTSPPPGVYPTPPLPQQQQQLQPPPVAVNNFGPATASLPASPPRSLDILGSGSNSSKQANVFSPDAEVVNFDSSSKSVL